jgi:hypothetical protein
MDTHVGCTSPWYRLPYPKITQPALQEFEAILASVTQNEVDRRVRPTLSLSNSSKQMMNGLFCELSEGAILTVDLSEMFSVGQACSSAAYRYQSCSRQSAMRENTLRAKDPCVGWPSHHV